MTLGHLDIVARASQMFEHIWMAVAFNSSKQGLVPVEERVALMAASVGHLSNVSIESFKGLTVDYALKRKAKVIIRGLRAISDFEKECAMAQMNKKLGPSIETVFLMASLEHQFLSSSLVKEIAIYRDSLEDLVPEPVHRYLGKTIRKESQSI